MTKETSKVIISVKDLHKKFRLPKERHTSVKQVFLGIFKKKHYVEQHVLKGVSFDIREGDFFGIIGRNGSGKSTLLKILAGIYTYDSGSLEIKGKISPFLELGVGFNPELTGWENIYLNGALLGLSKKEIDEKINEIIDFSELREFIDQKLKNYSSGMQVRLAFSVAIHAHAPIILLDEVLAVGDMKFQEKCYQVFEKLRNEGRTIVYVTHSMSSIRDLCNKVMVLNEGRVAYLGDPNNAAEVYYKINNMTEVKEGEESHKRRYGNGDCEIISYEIRGIKSEKIKSGEDFELRVKIKSKKNIDNLTLGFYLREKPDENFYGINSFIEGYDFTEIKKSSILEISIKDTMPLNPGSYFLSVAVSKQLSAEVYEDLDVLNNDRIIAVTSSDKEYWGKIVTKPVINHKLKIGEK